MERVSTVESCAEYVLDLRMTNFSPLGGGRVRALVHSLPVWLQTR